MSARTRSALPLAYRWFQFCLVVLFLSDVFCFSVHYPFLPQYLTSHGHSTFDVTLTFAAYGSACIVTLVVLLIYNSNRKQETISHARTFACVVISTAASGLAGFLMTLFGDNYLALLLTKAAQGACSAIYFTSTMVILTDVFPEEYRLQAMACVEAGLTLGDSIGPVVGGLAYQFGGLRGAFSTQPIISGITVAILMTLCGWKFAPLKSPSKSRDEEALCHATGVLVSTDARNFFMKHAPGGDGNQRAHISQHECEDHREPLLEMQPEEAASCSNEEPSFHIHVPTPSEQQAGNGPMLAAPCLHSQNSNFNLNMEGSEAKIPLLSAVSEGRALHDQNLHHRHGHHHDLSELRQNHDQQCTSQLHHHNHDQQHAHHQDHACSHHGQQHTCQHRDNHCDQQHTHDHDQQHTFQHHDLPHNHHQHQIEHRLQLPPHRPSLEFPNTAHSNCGSITSESTLSHHLPALPSLASPNIMSQLGLVMACQICRTAIDILLPLSLQSTPSWLLGLIFLSEAAGSVVFPFAVDAMLQVWPLDRQLLLLACMVLMCGAAGVVLLLKSMLPLVFLCMFVVGAGHSTSETLAYDQLADMVSTQGSHIRTDILMNVYVLFWVLGFTLGSFVAGLPCASCSYGQQLTAAVMAGAVFVYAGLVIMSRRGKMQASVDR